VSQFFFRTFFAERVRGRDAPATAGKMPALQKLANIFLGGFLLWVLSWLVAFLGGEEFFGEGGN
jgi:hypothetical protein